MAKRTKDAAITAQGVTKRFGNVLALDGLDLHVPAGRVFGLLGPNGAGKTTAVRVFTTIFRPDAGRASVLGYDVVTDAAHVRENIGLAGQYAAVDENLTGRENLKLVGRLTHLPKQTITARSDELLERFELVDAADRPVKTYSGGMRRRLDVAAALVHRPPILFLDEPTTGLDVQSRMELWRVIEELVADGATVLLTTQYLEEADRLADRIAVVDQGKVIAEGTPAQLKRNLGATVLDLTFPDGRSAERAAAALKTLVKRDPIIEGEVVEVPVLDGAKFVANVLTTLNRKRLAPAALAVREPSLDDVFLTLTGKRATADETNGQPSTNGSTNARARARKRAPSKSKAKR
jgi:daunorubicin resistance ABC transporter ATP-binding subunit